MDHTRSSVLDRDYSKLEPLHNWATDSVVLSQAWKKSHTYIRRHNWYADVIELDTSTADIESHIKQWQTDMSSETYVPDDVLLVPAPKNHPWEFRAPPTAKSFEELAARAVKPLEPHFDEWGPRQGVGTAQSPQFKLRPLAHVSIRDQTIATAIVMCLANPIETLQGNTSAYDAERARELGISSYGNRLQCSWTTESKGDVAAFPWGNSKIYRQYFHDYRSFLARPRAICSRFGPHLQAGRELYVVSLDIKSFFDEIDVAALLGELKNLSELSGVEGDSEFWSLTKRALNWRWSASDAELAPLLSDEDGRGLPEGLPQGLVASGFLANAYMIAYDSIMSDFGNALEPVSDEVKIIDYCRYVDDMRIVVEGPPSRDSENIKQVLDTTVAWAEKHLGDHCNRMGARKTLAFSAKKSSISSYRSMSVQSHLSAQMELLNGELSGTFDLDSLTQAAGGLDGLLSISEIIDESPPSVPTRLSLASVSTPRIDIREDTVKRFVASRLAQLLRQRLAMAEHSMADDSHARRTTTVDTMSHEFESASRKLVRCWSLNPSLVVLLRCGLDLYPHPRILHPILESIFTKALKAETFESQQQKEIKAIQFVLAEIFRAGATETGYRSKEEYPTGADISGYREMLAAAARRVLNANMDTPWYLKQQAVLYLVSSGDHSIAIDEPGPLRSYVLLQKASKYERRTDSDLLDCIPQSLIVQQLHPNPRRFAEWLKECLDSTISSSLQTEAIRIVSLNRPDLIAATYRAAKGSAWRKFISASITHSTNISEKLFLKSESSKSKGHLPLLTIMRSADNVFSQENALLALGISLLSLDGIETTLAAGLSAAQIKIACKDWGSVQSLSEDPSFMSILADTDMQEVNPIYLNPSWVAKDKAWLYGFGRIMRGALTGELDFTSGRFISTEENGPYSGLRSTWYKRRFGLSRPAGGLEDEAPPVSPWLNGLISSLLQWPGSGFKGNESTTAASCDNAHELRELLNLRAKKQRALFGSRSKTPFYVVPTNEDSKVVDRKLRVAIIQPMKPRRKEFNSGSPTFWSDDTLAAHRRHLAEVCRLAHQKLKTWSSATSTQADAASPIVDIVLFPELAVHPEHVFLLRRLSDKLKCNIFTGLTFLESKSAGGIVNTGLWIIRSESESHGRTFQYIRQGKAHPMKLEIEMDILGHRPHMTLVELPIGSSSPTRVAAAICYDATDLDLVADLRERSDVFLVAALNQDVQTFDNMVAALHFHMYQPVVLANSGEFGGSTAQVPLPKHERLVAHVHGNEQVAVSVFELDPNLFKSLERQKPVKEKKSPPAGYRGRPTQ